MDLIGGYALEQERRGLAASTIYKRNTDLRAWVAWLHPRTVADATEQDVQTFLDQRRGLDGQRISSKTRYTWLSTIHGFYHHHVRAGRLPHDPTDCIVRPKVARNLPRPISDADLGVALESAGTVMHAWLTLGAYAGLRCAEIGRLQRADVIDGQGLLRILGKGNKERLVPIHPNVSMSLRVAGMPHSGYLFRRPRGGRYTDAQVSREIALYFDGLGIDATAHQLRHWFGTKTYAACRDIRVVQELLGHSDPKTTAIYTAFSRDDASKAVMAIGLAA